MFYEVGIVESDGSGRALINTDDIMLCSDAGGKVKVILAKDGASTTVVLTGISIDDLAGITHAVKAKP